MLRGALVRETLCEWNYTKQLLAIQAGEAGGENRAGVGVVRNEVAAGSVESTDAGSGADASERTDVVLEDVWTYDRFQKVDRASYERVNEFLKKYKSAICLTLDTVNTEIRRV